MLGRDVTSVHSPKARPSVHQIKHLSRIEELLEAPQELDALVVARFRVDEDQERRTALRPDGFPGFVRPCVRRRHISDVIGSKGAREESNQKTIKIQGRSTMRIARAQENRTRPNPTSWVRNDDG